MAMAGVENDVVHGSSSNQISPRDFILSVASNIASQSLQNSNPHVWGVLTAISKNARKRTQGINILLTGNEHCIGRLVEDVRFQIDSHSVSANHCRIYRMKVTNENMEDTTAIFLKDTSTNGTYLNWEKLKKNSAAVKVRHGDIISFAAPPQHEIAFAFVYREVSVSTPMPDNIVPKRKAEEFVSENKRLKGLGIGAPEGPISLDDFRSLQRSNTEQRKQLESQVVLIETLRNENRAAAELHESELKSVKEATEKCYFDQVKELQLMVDLKEKELVGVNKVSAEQKCAMEDLNERLSASIQSCAEANDIISSQKVNIAELKEQLDEERTQRKEEREKAADDLKAAVHRAQSEALEELKRLSDASSKRAREQQEAINKLQESEREQSLLVETLRSKLEDTRQKLVLSENKVRQLETQVHKEQLACANELKKVEELEQETKRLRKELESEKQTAREEAWAKVSVLELEITAAMRDLDFERRRLKGARERLMLRETQLRSFYSTTEEIQKLFAKQQEQLKSMQKTLEDDENYDDTSNDMDGLIGGTSAREKEVAEYYNKNAAKVGLTTYEKKVNRDQVETSSDEASVTEKHDCDIRSQECQNTQEAEFTSEDHDPGVRGGFGSNIDGGGTVPLMEGDVVGTERVHETESPRNLGEQNIDLNKRGALEGDTLQFDDDVCVEETEEHVETNSQEVLHHSQSNNAAETQKTIEEDTEVGDTIRTIDLISSEVAGSWAVSTAPSADGENKYTRSIDKNEGPGALHDSNGVVVESQNNPSAATRENDRRALSEMIGIVAPELREQFGGSANDCDKKREKHGCISDSETESCSDTGSDDDIADVDEKGGPISDAETDTGDHVEEDPMDEDDVATQEDSLG
ncbi:PREDICTED: myosin heavy chain, striated muscle-like isoform X1 [Lupinus angustifolius]|uniref:myosin heavy chain, striated muscle-like isoform X1 n=1 Tax=Lupinus angustifolius TaxID=3871 RepID=UPI00092F6D31|nr:PREDICTED: myosin heavy chain, striated muscle-like isoform X1 [Lupinus angustifolius]